MPPQREPEAGWPWATIIRAQVAMRDGELLGGPTGRPGRFIETLPHGGGGWLAHLGLPRQFRRAS